MAAIVLVQPGESMLPVIGPPAVAPAGRHAAIVAVRIASCVDGSLARSGTAFVAAATPTDGSAAISFIALSVARMKPATAARFDWRVVPPTMTPGPGRRSGAATVGPRTALRAGVRWPG